MKKTSRAPLPFLGQKRNQIKNIREVLKLFDDNATYVDVFGGSGLLSQIISEEKPYANVIWNDFDNYKERLDGISDTNELLEQIYAIFGHLKHSEKLDEILKSEILQTIENFKGYKDFITLSSHLLFSGSYVFSFEELKKQNFYKSKNTKRPKYSLNEYLSGVKRVSMCGFELLDRYNLDNDVVLVLDPPYLQTLQSGYKNYFNLADFLRLCEYLKTHKMILFGSHRSDLLPFLEFGRKKLGYMNYEVIKNSKGISIKGCDSSIDYMVIRREQCK